MICVCDGQGPDLTLEQFLKIVEECCLRMVNAVKHRYASSLNKELFCFSSNFMYELFIKPLPSVFQVVFDG